MIKMRNDLLNWEELFCVIRNTVGLVGMCSEKLNFQSYLEMLWSKAGYF